MRPGELSQMYRQTRTLVCRWLRQCSAKQGLAVEAAGRTILGERFDCKLKTQKSTGEASGTRSQKLHDVKRQAIGDWEAFSERCQKPGYRRIGNWFARRVSRPLALHVTWILLPTGISAHAVTFVAWTCTVAAAVAFGCGGNIGWLAGAGLLQLWYLLDHVDGQIARYRERESLDGVQLDYLMHHTVDILIPCGLGFGLFQANDSRGWLVAGLTLGHRHALAGFGTRRPIKGLHPAAQASRR